MNSTPASLIMRLQKPDDGPAWRRFVELFAPLLERWARRLGVPNSESEDLIQDVLTNLLKALPTFHYDPKRSFRAYLWTTMRHAWVRRCQQPQTVLLGDAGYDIAASEPEPPGESEYRALLVQRAMQIMQADFAPATWKACCGLVLERRRAADLARELGLTVNAVHLARARVLSRLRHELSGLIG